MNATLTQKAYRVELTKPAPYPLNWDCIVDVFNSEAQAMARVEELKRKYRTAIARKAVRIKMVAEDPDVTRRRLLGEAMDAEERAAEKSEEGSDAEANDLFREASRLYRLVGMEQRAADCERRICD